VDCEFSVEYHYGLCVDHCDFKLLCNS